ncbi:MAG: hypothetical protein A3A83_00050 [Candidatus Doudnabacteria bacterium RIFCSPLOWO2_01_FULL_48_57]|uniref:Transcription regulator TrmB N-terminal domain-containing protein n=1 Tax=Candidatus Doudnabacteria bacterium RIFCSPLOWO2_02_FULL_48_13 TaxID=1817845 RepID=A0A1F5Q8Z8_9BACT|nr:MAG: hypothetical protein A3K05_01570 [Candidatus Doudnabacteria bacterium RIFCSPHIGHO2_01_48_18]OGE90986.1 MAG: hypothetical protein A3F44_01040 [Candidatus Doudnabacteria bacterium RIFCSPHIGHO2_12_FULL_47_25]OGE96348.1 MAG: hypothetical protein A3A83_00050 [Candidatus Doudnabacteria bacterium RIFCSPLOWO2_01_FULL_48_57]OGE98587.1 MAG: hypothetical protein A3J05_01220 [Candidatus Doudnabacteria bacterium RIFCSPLOWO2_02_FULL_48_13]OGF00630.1 MAG: hypothetical protein A3G07_03925 [Candidatus D
MIVENLLQFGLDEKEISVYLSLISLGPAPASAISKQSQVNRGTTYDILERLMKLGLVSFYNAYKQDDSKKQHYVAEPPQKLVNAVENKKRNLDTLKLNISKSLPELESLYEKSGARPVAKYYEGSAGLRVILQDVLSTLTEGQDKSYFVYSSSDIKEYLYKAYPDFNKDRIKAGIANKVIAFGKGGELAGLDERRCMSEEESTPTYMLIYAGKVAMISLSATREPVGVIIEDQGLYQTQRMIFEFIWLRL